MGVIYIGDRAVGKTHLALELASPRNQHVEVLAPNYDNLKTVLGYSEAEGTSATQDIGFRFLEIQARLPAGNRNVELEWIDTPGEIWRPLWQQDNPDQWEGFLESSRASEGILLILNPFREMLRPEVAANPNVAMEYSNRQQWCNRFSKWVDFFKEECPKARHIVICLNKADLFVEDLEREAVQLAYSPDGSRLTWRKRHAYVLQRHFRPIQQQIEQINKGTRGLSVQCFITSIHSRPLLELPWVYLASFLAAT